MKKSKLLTLASQLGSDVPFFINEGNAWVEGKGDILTNIFIQSCTFILVLSNQVISTQDAYGNIKLREKLNDASYEDFLSGNTSNSFEYYVFKKYPAIKKAAKTLMTTRFFTNISLLLLSFFLGGVFASDQDKTLNNENADSRLQYTGQCLYILCNVVGGLSRRERCIGARAPPHYELTGSDR